MLGSVGVARELNVAVVVVVVVAAAPALQAGVDSVGFDYSIAAAVAGTMASEEAVEVFDKEDWEEEVVSCS